MGASTTWSNERGMKVRFFRRQSDFRTWLAKYHDTAEELWVGYYKRSSQRESITWQESVDEALCFGWIDGIRKSIDDISYTIRFTPRRSRSIWSAVNIKRATALAAQGLMQPAGLRAFEARKEDRSGIYSYEQRPASLVEPYAQLMRENPAAWEFFRAQPPSYQRIATWYIVSAKREDTRLKRLQRLIEDSAAGRRLPYFTKKEEPPNK